MSRWQRSPTVCLPSSAMAQLIPRGMITLLGAIPGAEELRRARFAKRIIHDGGRADGVNRMHGETLSILRGRGKGSGPPAHQRHGARSGWGVLETWHKALTLNDCPKGETSFHSDFSPGIPKGGIGESTLEREHWAAWELWEEPRGQFRSIRTSPFFGLNSSRKGGEKTNIPKERCRGR